MKNSFSKILKGYEAFREKYAHGDESVMHFLSNHGQKPQIMVVACCDSRVDPALILQCDPGDLFVVRNVANIIPPFEKDEKHHGTSAALEFGIRFLKVKHLILLGHSQCGGIQALLESNHHCMQNQKKDQKNFEIASNLDSKTADDFITNWVSLISCTSLDKEDPDACAKLALNDSYQNCMTFPWIKERVESQELQIHLWFFDIKKGQIFTYSNSNQSYQPL